MADFMPKAAPRFGKIIISGEITEDEEITKLLQLKEKKKPPSPVSPFKINASPRSSWEDYSTSSEIPPPIPPKPKRDQNTPCNSSTNSYYSFDSDSDIDTQENHDYMTVLKNFDHKQRSIFNGIEERFEETLAVIISAEDNFLKQYIEIGKNSSYYKIREESKSAAIKIFGAVTELLLLHTEMRQNFQKCTSPTDLAEVFIKHKEKLRLHIADQWKLCQCEDPNVIVKKVTVYNAEFPTLSQKLISTYRDQMHSFLNDDSLKVIDSVQYANKILTTTYQQIVFINLALKSIVDPDVILSECGDVLYVGNLTVKHQLPSLSWKKMDIFFMQKYIILTKKKNEKLYFISSIPAHDVDYKAKESDMTIHIYSMHEKKKFLLIKIPKEKITEFQTIKSILQIMNEAGMDLL